MLNMVNELMEILALLAGDNAIQRALLHEARSEAGVAAREHPNMAGLEGLGQTRRFVQECLRFHPGNLG